MRIITTGTGCNIKIMSSGKEGTIQRFSELQKHLLLDSDIGNTVDAVNLRYQKIAAYIQEGKIEDALIENENALFCIRSILSGTNYKTLAFACLVIEIDGITCNDLTEEGLNATSDLIKKSGLTQQDLEDSLDEVKKKLTSN